MFVWFVYILCLVPNVSLSVHCPFCVLYPMYLYLYIVHSVSCTQCISICTLFILCLVPNVSLFVHCPICVLYPMYLYLYIVHSVSCTQCISTCTLFILCLVPNVSLSVHCSFLIVASVFSNFIFKIFQIHSFVHTLFLYIKFT